MIPPRSKGAGAGRKLASGAESVRAPLAGQGERACQRLAPRNMQHLQINPSRLDRILDCVMIRRDTSPPCSGMIRMVGLLTLLCALVTIAGTVGLILISVPRAQSKRVKWDWPSEAAP